MSLETELTAAVAAAEQQMALNRDALNSLVARARALLRTNDEPMTWALLGVDTARQLNCATKHQQFAAETLALAAIRLARIIEDDDV